LTMPDNGARSLHEFIVGNLFGMAMQAGWISDRLN